VVLGRIAPDAVLGDRVAVDRQLAEDAVASLGTQVGPNLRQVGAFE